MGPFSATRFLRTDSTAAWLTVFFLVGGAVGPPGDLFPVDLHARGFQDAASRGGYFRPDSFARDESNFVSDHCILL